MKILTLFIDMLGGEYMNLCNKNMEFTCVDEFFQDIGGTLYSNCYTPAPDTPRSSACMWTGLYPKANWCNNRVKWPQPSLNRTVDNIWDILLKNGYKVNIFLDENSDELGLIPFSGNECIYHDSIYQFFEYADITDNSFNFFYLIDLHSVLDEFGYAMKGYREGLEFEVSIVKEIFNYYKAEEIFDYIIIFSDHGFRAAEKSTKKHIIDDDRMKTFMFIRKKDDKCLVIDDQLRANLDLMPTICDILNYIPQNKIDGISLLKKDGHPYVLIEDMNGFSVEIGQTIEHWCVVLKNKSKHWLECSGFWEHEDPDECFDERIYTKLIEDKMSNYIENIKVFPTAYRYQKSLKMNKEIGRYATGERFYKMVYEYKDEAFLFGKRLVLYGAGNVGKDYYRQLKESGSCEIVAWVDINYEECNDFDREIKGINKLFEMEYDYILIGIFDKHVVTQVKRMLEQLHIEKDRVLWTQPELCRKPRIVNV